ncbi:AraC family transcriptional regulator with amidase-like domain [Nocardiopsis sp. Huas11]|uniref:GlxA family transcriptional regulator n=1 Tax=Nocardiopsis sp. Huas11 TaxID=2183912 RepID=UPI000F21C646|nr:helix-turn-helix domain-containing protein [Nocardiopsis sp. Huas11]RKS08437.1 AraC family transcriptional regulator with amidase-like domain [Nocardiopsis sp. Huas11]
MRKKHATHRVAVVLTPGAPLFELAVPCEVFGAPRPGLIDPPYEVVLCATRRGASVASGFLATEAGSLHDAIGADTVIVPACADVDEPPDHGLVDMLRSAHGRGARIVGLCSGAFALAAAGLLDGKRATTHWMYAERVARWHPAVSVDPAVLYTAEANVFTSAGTAAAIDLCLELVRRDRGAAVVNELARRLVVPPHRAADQAQFVSAPVPVEPDTGLGPVLEWARGRLHERITLAELAAHAHVSPRTLNRRFEREYGLTPSRWLHTERLRRAQQLLEATELSIEQVARQSGFGTPTSLRQAFARGLHTSPKAYRNTFRLTPAQEA